MKVLNWDNFSLIRVSEQIDPRTTNPLIRKKLDALDDVQYMKYINTCHLVSEVSRRLNDLETYLADDCTKEELERKMKRWTTDLYDKS